MASLTRRGSTRYLLAKVAHAVEEVVQAIIMPRSGAGMAASGPQPTSLGVLVQALSKFRESYNQRLTTVMYLAGTSMAPAINKAALEDRDALEKLVVRQIPRPSARSVFVGDVVAFTSPLGIASKEDDVSHVLVRRVAAVEGEEMEIAGATSAAMEEDDTIEEVPKGHCWVLGDNQELKPPQMIDSRTFGFVPMSNIIGRVIFAGTSPSECGAITNSPTVADADQAIIEAEVDPDQLFEEDNK